jgi:hypothetical protein
LAVRVHGRRAAFSDIRRHRNAAPAKTLHD